MPNPRLAERYAKSLMDIAVEKQVLEKVYSDLTLLKNTVNNNREFFVYLKSPIIHADKKIKIFKAIFKDNLTEITILFVTLLMNKSREGVLPEIVDAALRQYRKIKHIQQVKMTTAHALSKKLTSEIVAKIDKEIPEFTIDLVSNVKEDLIGGFVLETNNTIYDASVVRKLQDVRTELLEENL